MASSSVAALLIGGGAPAAFAACYTGPFTGGYTNAAGISCITVIGTTVNGNITNSSTGTITATGTNFPTINAIVVSKASIVGSGSLTGSVINAGTINASAGYGILFTSNANASGGVSNSGTISAGVNGIAFGTISTFSGGITNGSGGTIFGAVTGIDLTNITAFAGGITNSGTVSSDGPGVSFYNVGTFSGGITNSSGGTISGNSGIFIANLVTQFTGGITNAGTIQASSGFGISVNNVTSFSQGIINTGTIVAAETGIGVYTVTTFGNGITNSGTISVSGSHAAVVVDGVSQFSGGISNAGAIISALGDGISVQASTFSGDIINSKGGPIFSGSATGAGILVSGTTQFNDNIINNGTIRANGSGIVVGGDVLDFLGGVTNGGAIAAVNTGIVVSNVTTFGGGITNTGMISVSGRIGISVNGSNNSGPVAISTFAGGIANSGTISAGQTGIAVTGQILTFSDDISNSGTISAVRSGIVVSGVTTFAGAIVNSGTISVNSGTVSPASSLHAGIAVSNVSQFSNGIANGGTILGYNGIAVTGVSQFGNGITNAGTITVAHNAIKVLNVPTFSGGITNNRGGTISAFTGLEVSNVRQFASGITNSGAITANKTGIFLGTITSFSGNVSNAGTISGVSAIRILGGVTFAAGSAIVNSGTINASAVAIDGHSATGAVTIDQAGGVITGAILLSSNADVLNISGGAINGNITGKGSSDTINFAFGAGNTFTYANNFTGINQVNINSGTVTLNGSDVATAIDVNGGTLAGIGTLDPLAVTIHSGATLAPGTPGAAGGKLSIVGNLVFQSAAAYLVTINGPSTSYTSVTGTATLGGAHLSLANGSTVVPGLKYTILTDTGGGLGGANTFAGAVSYNKYKGTLSYDADDVYLTFQSGTLRSLLAPGAPINITNTVAAIDNFNSGGTAPAAFQNLGNLSPAQLQSALAQLSGEAATGAERSAFAMTTDFLNLTLDPFISDRGGNSAGGPALGFAPEEGAGVPDDVARAYASVLGNVPPASFQQRWSAWGAAYGGSSNSRGDLTAGSNTVTASAFGFAGGVDYHVTPSSLAGFALAGGGTGWGLANALGSGRSDALQIGGYGISWIGPAYFAGALSLSNHWFTTNRTALGDQLAASFVGQSYGARFEGGYRYGVLPTLGMTPYGAVQAQAFHTPAYSERDPSGGGLGLSYGATNATDLRTELGARFDAPTLLYGKPLVLYGRAAWAHDFVSAPTLGAVFESLSGAGFAVNGAPFPHDSALTSVGAQLHVSANWSLTGTFNGDFASSSQTYSGNGTLRYTW